MSFGWSAVFGELNFKADRAQPGTRRANPFSDKFGALNGSRKCPDDQGAFNTA